MDETNPSPPLCPCTSNLERSLTNQKKSQSANWGGGNQTNESILKMWRGECQQTNSKRKSPQNNSQQPHGQQYHHHQKKMPGTQKNVKYTTCKLYVFFETTEGNSKKKRPRKLPATTRTLNDSNINNQQSQQSPWFVQTHGSLCMVAGTQCNASVTTCIDNQSQHALTTNTTNHNQL